MRKLGILLINFKEEIRGNSGKRRIRVYKNWYSSKDICWGNLGERIEIMIYYFSFTIRILALKNFDIINVLKLVNISLKIS